jgi:predicted nuclease of predicted toxin-antitoxin system
VKLLLDEMLPATIAEQLRRRGHDVGAVSERPEIRGLPDPELFEHSALELRAIVTYNRDDDLKLDRQYRAAQRNHTGVIILNPRRFPQGAATIGAHISSLETFLSQESPYPSFIHWLR